MGRATRSMVAIGVAGTVALLGLATTAGADTAAVPSTASFDFTVAVTKASTTTTVTGNGSVDFSTGDVAATLTLPAGVGGATASTATLAPSGNVQVEVTGGTAYLAIPQLASILGRKQWLSVPLPTAAAATAAKAGQAVAEGLANVPDLLSDITAPGTTVRMIGTQTINGEVATGYQATVDPAKALASVPGLMAGLGSSGRSGHHGIPATVPVRLWADSTGRLVRASVILGHKGSAATPQQVVMSVTVTGYDQAFSVTPPAPSTTLSLPAGALKQLFGSLGGAGALGGLLTPGTSSTTTTAGA